MEGIISLYNVCGFSFCCQSSSEPWKHGFQKKLEICYCIQYGTEVLDVGAIYKREMETFESIRGLFPSLFWGSRKSIMLCTETSPDVTCFPKQLDKGLLE